MSKIGTKSFVSENLRNNQLNAKKRFGQNFLTDQNILASIVEKANLDTKTAVIEIGPGLGALTEHLCKEAGFVLAYEIDKDLIAPLKSNLNVYKNLCILNEDILKADVEGDIKKYLMNYEKIYVVANLPYYITTPILLGLLSKGLPIMRYVVMMQLEVADRICGKPQTKDYNALSVLIGYNGQATRILKVPRTAFMPIPNVDSAVVLLDVYADKPIKAQDEQLFYEVIKICFAQRRKTLFNNLTRAYDKDLILKLFEHFNLKPAIRAEELTIKDFVLISDYLHANIIL